MKKVILIYGLPATGKLTIAELLKKEIENPIKYSVISMFYK